VFFQADRRYDTWRQVFEKVFLHLRMFTFLDRLFGRRAPVAPSAEPRSDAAAVTHALEEGSDKVAVFRKALLTRDKKVAGYEFLQPCDAVTGQVDSLHEQAFLEFVDSAVASGMLGKRRAFMAISGHLLFDPLLEKLARAGVIVLLRLEPEVKNIAQIAERMQIMHSAGMQLGLADARAALVYPQLGDCVNVGFLPVDQLIPPDLLDAVRRLTKRHPQMQLCACGVNSYEEFEVCRRLRMFGFIGPFATHHRDWQHTTVDPGTLRLFKLVNSLRAGAEMEVIVQDIKLDPLLSYRILCYANSAAMGAQRKILALKDAILLIGREPLFRWLVLLLCTSAPSHAEDSALLESALARGRTMELLAEKVAPAQADDFFLTGVLSLLDVILHLPVPTLMEALDLPDEIKAALLERKGPYAGLLQLAEAGEHAQLDVIHHACAELGIDPGTLSQVQTEASNWARGQSGADADETAFVIEPPAVVAMPGGAPDTESAHIADAVQTDQSLQVPTEPDVHASDRQLEAAQRGDPEAQCALAARYAQGDGVVQDKTQSLAWYTQAAQQGNAKAQWNVAVMQMRGQGGTEADAQHAARWCQLAADQGFAPAQATLGLMYAGGQGVEKDLGKALALLNQAALQGDAEAQYNLAILYEQGLADKPDLDQAFAWFSKAAEHGLPAAQERLGLMYAIGQPMEQNLMEACKWFFIASEGKLASAKANLAHSRTLMEPHQVLQAEQLARLWMQNHAVAHSRGEHPSGVEAVV
jgi:TPR repeat protein/c-di-GMP-related signal transduction protein